MDIPGYTPEQLEQILAVLTPKERLEVDLLLRTPTIVEKLGIPRPYPLQREIMQHPARFKVVCAGRRAGKTTMAAEMALECMYNGRKALLSSATQDQSDQFWDYVKEWTSGEKDVYKNENRRIMNYGRGQIRVKTGRDPDVLRGGDCDLLVLDECALLLEETWYKVGQPMLADRNGFAVFISTPRRRNWFYELYMKAKNDETGQWKAWNFSSHLNPHLSAEAMKALAQDMNEDDYKQEILAEFMESDGAVFRHVDERATLRVQDPYVGSFVFGIDWGKVNDYTVVNVFDTALHEMVAYARFKDADWNIQREWIKTLYDQWHPTMMIAEVNAAGDPNVDALLHEGFPVQPFMTSPTTKGQLIESLALAFDRDELRILDDITLKDELKAYERKSTLYGRATYSAPPGAHDDMVIALALAWQGVTMGRGVFFTRL